MERTKDPGDEAVPEESARTNRVLITVDKGFGRLVNVEGRRHAGFLLLDETPILAAQLTIVRSCLERYRADLEDNVFIRVTADGRVRRRRRK